ncbi:uncharacterized protein LOC115228710 [Octopus sinensis]|uniref:Uncharacterized protein LOC115228710 n=1 Tax=Octopus sinensis TaxID=2607531 RepID=A0A6P7TYT8_9MOLL|nr:uncharacterized protein LOC115228710 [Octopus sinensis]
MRIGEMVEDCPVSFLFLAFQCCQIDPDRRFSFPQISLRLESTLIDYINYGLTVEHATCTNKPWMSLNDLSSFSEQDCLGSELDLPSLAEVVPECEDLRTMSPREVGQAMTHLDPHYTSHGLGVDSILSLMAMSSNRAQLSAVHSTEESQSTRPSESNTDHCPPSHRRTHSLPYTQVQLKKLADRSLCSLPSDRNLKMKSDNRGEVPRLISRTLIHEMHNHAITLPMAIVNCKDTSVDSACTSVSIRRAQFANKSISDIQRKHAFAIENDFFQKFMSNCSSSSIYSSFDSQSDVQADKCKFYRFMRRYLTACLNSQNTFTNTDRRIIFTPETLKRMRDARELFKSLQND